MKRYLGFVAFGISVISLVTWRILDIAGDGSGFDKDPVGEALMGLAFLAYPAVGSLIMYRQPENGMGWVFSGVGALVGIGGTAQAYAESVLPNVTSPGLVDYVAAWITNWWWFPLLGLVMVFTSYLFPTGRPLSPRWRIVFVIGVVGIVLVTVAGMVQPSLSSTTESGRSAYEIDNPIGVSGLGDPEEGPLAAIGFGAFALSALLGVISLIVRFFRSRGVEREQLKWFAFGALLIPVNTFGESLLEDLIGETNAFFAIAIGALPVSAGIAILRYRLYEIDVVINRALVYGSLTAILAAAYVGLVFSMQTVLEPVTAESDLAIAASTLAVAALFRPLRARVQKFIDHRFYRRRYDAQQTVEEFASHLRDEVDLSAVVVQLVDVARDTMQPAHVSVWMRRETTA